MRTMNDDDFAKMVDKETDRMFRGLAAEDVLGVVIRGHLFVESKLIQLIEAKLPDAGAVDLTRLDFRLKLDLAVALKLLSENQKRGYVALNALRNKFAHDIDAQLLEADERDLFLKLSDEQRAEAEGLDSSSSFGKERSLLKSCIAALCSEILTRFLDEAVTISPSTSSSPEPPNKST